MPKVVNHEVQRRQIALAACRALARRGVDATTLADIATEAKVTTGMITHYFKTKREIVAAALRLVFQRTEQRVLNRLDDGEDRLLSILEESLPLDAARRRESAVWVSFWGRVTTDRTLARVNRAVHDDAVELYAKVIRLCWPESTQWSASLFDAVHASLLNFLNGLTASAVTSPQSWPPARQREALEMHIQLLRQFTIR
ncbi:MAG: hypothetical protein DHS20C01_29450 [marine bacterium B5-7]|nr:MAG: hypothetical protein DHS20C01_29450 [marine bacterium B5-7]